VVAVREDGDVEVGARFVTGDLEFDGYNPDGVGVNWIGVVYGELVVGMLELGRGGVSGLAVVEEEDSHGLFL
jgi:hypothetical protein